MTDRSAEIFRFYGNIIPSICEWSLIEFLMGFLCSKFYYGDEDLSGRLRGIGACSEVSKTITVLLQSRKSLIRECGSAG
ncbi:hypothetical protein M758_7G098400 [Ceratodon purpureus]|nr:hypothetical protein M758_7G098400 [Ceratodon purpureus]